MNPLSLLKAAASQSELGRNMAGTPQACRAAARVVDAATALYMAGVWYLPTGGLSEAAQGALWLELRDALGLAPGTATAAGVGGCQPHGCPKCDDAIECDCEPPLPMFDPDDGGLPDWYDFTDPALVLNRPGAEL